MLKIIRLGDSVIRMGTPEEFVAAVSKQLVAERNASGLSLNELAEKAGISRSTLHLFEKGKRTPDMRQVSLIADALDLSTMEFLRRAEDRVSK